MRFCLTIEFVSPTNIWNTHPSTQSRRVSPSAFGRRWRRCCGTWDALLSAAHTKVSDVLLFFAYTESVLTHSTDEISLEKKKNKEKKKKSAPPRIRINSNFKPTFPWHRELRTRVSQPLPTASKENAQGRGFLPLHQTSALQTKGF